MTTPLRLRVIAPIALPAAAIAGRRQRYRELAGPRFEVTLDPLADPDAPRALDDEDAIAASHAIIRAQIDALDPADADLAMPDCVLDPGLVVGHASAVPAVGILHLVAGHLAALGRRFSAVTRNEPIADELARKLDEYGLYRSLVGVDVIHGGVELISDEPEWIRRLGAVVRTRGAAGVDTVFNGCSAVPIPPEMTAAGAPVAVVDPTLLALRLLSVALDSGLVGGAPQLFPGPKHAGVALPAGTL
jgi:Asp/Glu/hydantoin racemase